MENRYYPTYQYMKFIWQKKLYLIGFTVFCMIAAAAYSYIKTPVYSSTALVFTGNAENYSLSKPDLITAEYKKDIPDDVSLKVSIPEEYEIALTVTGKNKKTVESAAKKVSEHYTDDLMKNFQNQKNVYKNYVKSVEEKIKQAEGTNPVSGQQISGNPSDGNLTYTMVIDLESLEKAQVKLEKFDEPKLTSITTTASANHLLRNLLLGGALGFQVMLIMLVFWKYIIDARRSDS